MTDASPNIVHKQLSEHKHQVMHLVQVGNQEKEILSDDIKSVPANMVLLENRILKD
jgi:hypothetical protein